MRVALPRCRPNANSVATSNAASSPTDCRRPPAGFAAIPVGLRAKSQKAVQHGVLQCGVIKVIAQPLRERGYPLPRKVTRAGRHRSALNGRYLTHYS